MKLEHIVCEILCNNEALAEYQEKLDLKLDSEDTGRKAKSCHIISEVGQRFTLRVANDPHRFDVDFHLWIDGQRVDTVYTGKAGPFNIPGVYTSASQVRPFIFSSITTTDDDSTLQKSLSTAQDLGTISMKVYRIKVDSSRWENVVPSSSNLDNEPVHEKTKKAGSHRVTLGDVEATETTKFVDITMIDPLDSPYYTFTWRYRPKAILQAQGTVPQDPLPPSNKRSGSSVPSTSGRSSKRLCVKQATSDQESSSQVKIEHKETARALKARQDALRAERVALEAREAALEEELRQADSRGVKREASSIVFDADNGDVIDLTEDD